MQPLHPVLLNSSAMAPTVDPQTLVSCWGVQDTVRHVQFCAGFPSVITATEFWDSNKHGEGHSLSFLSLHVHKGLVYFHSDQLHLQRVMTNTALNNKECSMERSVSQCGKAERSTIMKAVGWYWLFDLHFECPIIWKASCPLSVVNLISLKLIL